MIKKTLMVVFCATILLLIPFSTLAGPEIVLMNDPPFEDPDGPLEGGLDDIQDWVHVANALVFLGVMKIGISENEISDFDGIIHIIYEESIT